jgi:hypothetical protein
MVSTLGELNKYIAGVAFQKGLIKSKEFKIIEKEKLEKIHPHGSFIWGYNSLSQAVRARKLLGWTPHAPALEEEVEEILNIEKQRLDGKN